MALLGRVLTTIQFGAGVGLPPHHDLPGASSRPSVESTSRMMATWQCGGESSNFGKGGPGGSSVEAADDVGVLVRAEWALVNGLDALSGYCQGRIMKLGDIRSFTLRLVMPVSRYPFSWPTTRAFAFTAGLDSYFPLPGAPSSLVKIDRRDRPIRPGFLAHHAWQSRTL